MNDSLSHDILHVNCKWFLQKIFQVAKGNFEGLDLKKPQLRTTNQNKAKQDTNPPENTVLPTSWYILYICTSQSLTLKQKSFHIISLLSRRNNTKAALYGSNFQIYIFACHVEDQLQSKTDVRNISSSNLLFYVLTTDGDREAKIL